MVFAKRNNQLICNLKIGDYYRILIDGKEYEVKVLALKISDGLCIVKVCGESRERVVHIKELMPSAGPDARRVQWQKIVQNVTARRMTFDCTKLKEGDFVRVTCDDDLDYEAQIIDINGRTCTVKIMCDNTVQEVTLGKLKPSFGTFARRKEIEGLHVSSIVLGKQYEKVSNDSQIAVIPQINVRRIEHDEIANVKYKEGDYGYATYSDGVDYKIKILKILKIIGNCLIKYIGYDDEVEVPLRSIKPFKKKFKDPDAVTTADENNKCEEIFPFKEGDSIVGRYADGKDYAAQIINVKNDSETCIIKFVEYDELFEVDFSMVKAASTDLTTEKVDENNVKEDNIELTSVEFSKEKFSQGDYVLATYEDGDDYKATIVDLNEEKNTCIVKYVEYNDLQEISLAKLKQLAGVENAVSKKKEIECHKSVDVNAKFSRGADVYGTHDDGEDYLAKIIGINAELGICVLKYFEYDGLYEVEFDKIKLIEDQNESALDNIEKSKELEADNDLQNNITKYSSVGDEKNTKETAVPETATEQLFSEGDRILATYIDNKDYVAEIIEFNNQNNTYIIKYLEFDELHEVDYSKIKLVKDDKPTTENKTTVNGVLNTIQHANENDSVKINFSENEYVLALNGDDEYYDAQIIEIKPETGTCIVNFLDFNQIMELDVSKIIPTDIEDLKQEEELKNIDQGNKSTTIDNAPEKDMYKNDKQNSVKNDTKIEKAEENAMFSIGDRVYATYEDGIEYIAEIMEINVDKKSCVVNYLEYDELYEVKFENITKPLVDDTAIEDTTTEKENDISKKVLQIEDTNSKNELDENTPNSQNKLPHKYAEGDYVHAIYYDGQKYGAQIVEVYENSCVVKYIDYGEYQELGFDKIISTHADAQDTSEKNINDPNLKMNKESTENTKVIKKYALEVEISSNENINDINTDIVNKETTIESETTLEADNGSKITKFSVGDFVLATYEDGKDYDAEIIEIKSKQNKCVIKYIGYEELCEIDVEKMKPIDLIDIPHNVDEGEQSKCNNLDIYNVMLKDESQHADAVERLKNQLENSDVPISAFSEMSLNAAKADDKEKANSQLINIKSIQDDECCDADINLMDDEKIDISPGDTIIVKNKGEPKCDILNLDESRDIDFDKINHKIMDQPQKAYEHSKLLIEDLTENFVAECTLKMEKGYEELLLTIKGKVDKDVENNIKNIVADLQKNAKQIVNDFLIYKDINSTDDKKTQNNVALYNSQSTVLKPSENKEISLFNVEQSNIDAEKLITCKTEARLIKFLDTDDIYEVSLFKSSEEKDSEKVAVEQNNNEVIFKINRAIGMYASATDSSAITHFQSKTANTTYNTKNDSELKVGSCVRAIYFDGNYYDALILENHSETQSCLIKYLALNVEQMVPWRFLQTYNNSPIGEFSTSPNVFQHQNPVLMYWYLRGFYACYYQMLMQSQ